MEDTIISLLGTQYNHFFGALIGIIGDFPEDAWTELGSGYMTPGNVAMHICGSTRFYTDDSEDVQLEDGSTFDFSKPDSPDPIPPGQSTVVHLARIVAKRTDRWVSSLHPFEPNERFPWTGSDQLSVAVFLLRHSSHHMGELNALLHLSREGEIKDHFVLAQQ